MTTDLFIGLAIGLAVQPYALMLFETVIPFVLYRPRRYEPPVLCKGCTL